MKKTVVIGVILAMSTAVAIGGSVEPTSTDKIKVETTTNDPAQTSAEYDQLEEAATSAAEASENF